ncbi:MAG: zinc-ribbon domain-containing protein [Burkholderiaceae bacterium]|nr:zinc-ribbon domain-containing protein [Burkholderiaceae bacterium]
MNATTSPAAAGAETSAGRLQREIMTRYPDNFMLYADLFAMGCLLHLQGQHKAGLKLIDQVRRALPATGHKTYFVDLLEALPGNELRFAGEIQAHAEVNDLLELAQRQQAAPRYTARPAQAGLAKVTEVRTRGVQFNCPHCSTRIDGWQADPRGRDDKCDRCHQQFYIAPDATVIFD